MRETDDTIPPHLREWWTAESPQRLHSPAWWRHHWGRTGVMDIEVADTLPDGWRFWLEWLRLVAPDNTTEIRNLETDSGRSLGYVRIVGRRRPEAQLPDPITSVPAQYESKPLLRGLE